MAKTFILSFSFIDEIYGLALEFIVLSRKILSFD